MLIKSPAALILPLELSPRTHHPNKKILVIEKTTNKLSSLKKLKKKTMNIQNKHHNFYERSL